MTSAAALRQHMALLARPYVAFDRKEEVGAIIFEVRQIVTEVISEFPITSNVVGECTKKDTFLSCATVDRPHGQSARWAFLNHTSIH